MRRLRGDEGAVSTLFAVLLAFGVLLGLGAVVLDVGQAYAERRQLQNGADAAALAIAQDCAGDPACDVSRAAAEPWVDANTEGRSAAAIGGTRVFDVCGQLGAWSGSCGTGTGAGALVECLVPPGTPASWSGYVEVRTETLNDDGGSTLPRLLAGRVPEDEDAAVGVGACARAAWGPPASLDAFPFTFSECEWDAFTAAGLVDPPASDNDPAYENAHTDREIAIVSKDSLRPSACQASQPQADAPGAFGWLDDLDEDCVAAIELGIADGDTGNNVAGNGQLQQTCEELIQNSVGTVVWIPVHRSVSGQGANTEYEVLGFAGFYLTGFDLQGSCQNAAQMCDPPLRDDWEDCATTAGPVASRVPAVDVLAEPGGGNNGGGNNGGGNNDNGENNGNGGGNAAQARCFYGWFVHDLAPAGEIGGEDYGVDTVQLVG